MIPLANPPFNGRPMIVLLPGVKSVHANVVQASAFRHGKSGVGHFFFPAGAAPSDSNSTKVWREPSTDDPGQPPKAFDRLVPFAIGGLADHISALAELNEGGGIVQALFFTSQAEGQACQDEISAIFGFGGAA